jgi:hypothetical protein
MWRVRIALAAVLAAGTIGAGAATVSAHNAGCVQTGNGDYVFVGSNRDSPEVSPNNPNSFTVPAGTFLDLQPESFGSDQYGARYAADQGGSRVERPVSCSPSGPRAQ